MLDFARAAVWLIIRNYYYFQSASSANQVFPRRPARPTMGQQGRKVVLRVGEEWTPPAGVLISGRAGIPRFGVVMPLKN